MTTCVVVLGGTRPDDAVARRVPQRSFVIAADSGVDHAHGLGLTIDLAVGDFDSISAAGLARLTADRTPTQRFDVAKDASDGELALVIAAERRPDELIVMCGGGLDRLDHLLVTIATLTNPILVAVPSVSAWIGTNHVLVASASKSPLRWSTKPAETVTLLAVGGPAHGVTTHGLAWPLTDATLQPWSSWGLSNRALGTACEVSVRHGSVFVLLPGTHKA
jgi:thiamine pyrophosphokinase